MEPSEDGMRWQLVAALVFVAVIGIVGWWSLRAKHTPQPASQPAAAPARSSFLAPKPTQQSFSAIIEARPGGAASQRDLTRSVGVSTRSVTLSAIDSRLAS
jgi:hypothetical protein